MTIATLGPNFPIVTATGGTVTELNIGLYRYKIHTFTSSGTFSVSLTGNAAPFASPQIEYLVVAGGGGGTDPVIREYTANDTWTKPTAANFWGALVVCFGAGGGGGLR
jgi:hypothetical protein